MKKRIFLLSLFLVIGLVSCNNENDNKVEEVKSYNVTFHYHDGSTKKVTVNENEKVSDIGEDSLCEKDEKLFDGWYLEDSIYDFNSLVTKDIDLYSKCTPYSEIVTSIRWEFNAKIKNHDVYKERDTKNTSLIIIVTT